MERVEEQSRPGDDRLPVAANDNKRNGRQISSLETGTATHRAEIQLGGLEQQEDLLMARWKGAKEHLYPYDILTKLRHSARLPGNLWVQVGERWRNIGPKHDMHHTNT